jgi:hypothetical protein
MVPFHYDPAHSDTEIDQMVAAGVAKLQPTFKVTAAAEGSTFHLGS